MRPPRMSIVVRVAVPFLNISGEGIPPQYSFKFSDFSKCFLFSCITSAGLDRWLLFHIVEATHVIDCSASPEKHL